MISDYSQQNWTPEVKEIIEKEKLCLTIHVRNLYRIDKGLSLGILCSELAASLFFFPPEERKLIREDIIKFISAIPMDAFEDIEDMLSSAIELKYKILTGEINQQETNDNRQNNDPGSEQPPSSSAS